MIDSLTHWWKKNITLGDNPLLNPRDLPFGAVPFDDIKPEHFEPAVDWAIAEAQRNINEITASWIEPDFENIINALEFADEQLSAVMSPFSDMRSSLNTEEIQAVNDAIRPKLTEYSIGVLLNEKLFAKVKEVYDKKDTLSLNVEESKLLEDAYQSFANNGALLEGEDRERYKALSQKLSELTSQYGNNLVNSTKHDSLKIVIPANEAHRLDGIPENMVAFYKAQAKNDDNISDDDFMIPMAPPPVAVLEFANDRALRKQAKKSYSQIGAFGEFDNTPIVLDILKTRYELAQLLGFEHHADKTIRTDTRMAENYKTALEFVQKNAEIYYPVAKQFHTELEEFAKKRDGIDKLEDHDNLYYSRLMREEQIGYDPQETQPYFELDNCLNGMFQHAEKLYGVKFQEVEGKYPTMHEDVRVFEVLDKDTSDIRALYYGDFYARENKNGGAWMIDMRNAGLFNGEMQIPIVSNNCNFPKPEEDRPTLLDANENRTLWHEGGHGLHGILGKGTYPSLTGINVPWDYVELPSQINECWAFQPEVLKTYAKHHETGDIIPDYLIDKLQKLVHFSARSQGLRQSRLGLLDMVLYTTDPAEITNLKAFQDKVWEPISLTEPNDDAPPFVLSFGHIMHGGYAAGYYSYKWADALVADAFEQFERNGIYDPATCKSFREEMIEPGGTRPPSEMHKAFKKAAGATNTDLDPEAMFRAEGIPLPQKSAGGNTPEPKPGM